MENNSSWYGELSLNSKLPKIRNESKISNVRKNSKLPNIQSDPKQPKVRNEMTSLEFEHMDAIICIVLQVIFSK